MDIKGDRAFGVNGEFCDFIAADENFFFAFAGNRLERGRVDDALDGVDFAFDFLGGEFEAIRFAFAEWRAPEPEQAGFETSEFVGRIGFESGDGSAFDEDLFGERNADRFTGGGVVDGRRVPTFDGFDGAGFAGRREDEAVADFNCAGLDAAGENATFVETINVLDRHAQRLIAGRGRELKTVEHLDDGWAFPPRHVRADRCDVVAVFGGNGNELERFDAD